MALLMSGAMSFAMTLIQLGAEDLIRLLSNWFIAWGISFAVALPVTFMITPLVGWIVKSLTRSALA
ncbi:hypothetical protein MED121_02945 [Marinomonas sp. MED121]|nr:hypothetical protein MED121_02945 [Marinomonas sp. MED121]